MVDAPSVIVACLAVVFTFNPQVWTVCRWLWRKFLTLASKDTGRCERLSWDDLEDKLHCHTGSGGQVNCSRCIAACKQHRKLKKCWHHTVALVFNNAWDSKKRIRYCKKPDQLPLAMPFLRVEARVVLAYFLCTLRCDNFFPRMLGRSLEHIELRQHGGLTVAHLGAPNRILDLTKEEVSRIIDGWPPFYRKTFLSAEGHTMKSPLTSFEYVRRPGWIIAIGLGRVQPTDVYIDTRNQNDDETMFKIATRRVQTVLEEQFSPRWAGLHELEVAISEVKDIIQYGPSGKHTFWKHRPKIPDYATIPYPADVPHLTKEECETTMKVFNDMEMNDDQMAILEPVLKSVLARVTLGVAVALDYSRNHERRITIPPLLQGDETIYLRECFTTDG